MLVPETLYAAAHPKKFKNADVAVGNNEIMNGTFCAEERQGVGFRGCTAVTIHREIFLDHCVSLLWVPCERSRRGMYELNIN